MAWRHYQNSFLITQTGPDWKAFFGTHGRDPTLFDTNMFMEFRRAGGRIHGGATALDNASQKVRIEVPRSAIRTALAAVQLAGGPEKYARLPGVEPIDPVVREYWDKGVRVRNIDEFTLVQHRQYGWGAEDKGHNLACGLNVALTTD